MIEGLLILLLCQLAGTLVADTLHLPIPGAVLGMLLLLGLLASPHRLLEEFWPALGVAAFLMFVARPAAVIACLWPFGYRRAEIGFIAWTGLRGAVGIFLASIPLLAGLVCGVIPTISMARIISRGRR